jgi:hypothetical protein
MSDDHTKAMTVIETGSTAAMSPVVSAGMEILRQNPNPDTLRELLAVQKDFEANEARKQYAQALVDLKRNLPSTISRDKEVSFKSTFYTHASLGNVLSQIEQPLAQCGFTITWETGNNGRDVSVTCRLLHCAGHSESTTLTAPNDTSGAKNPIQAVGSTVTYLQRYTVLALLGLTTADMPNADQAPESSEPDVSVKRNQDVATKIVARGRAIKDAETHVGRPVVEWTSADIAKLREWITAKPDAHPCAVPDCDADAVGDTFKCKAHQ